MRYKIPQVSLRMVKDRTISAAVDRLVGPTDAATLVQPLIGNRPIEFLMAIMLDGQGKVTSIATLSQGGMHGAGVIARDVLRAVLVAHASTFVLVHNHPSGDPTPSKEDLTFTAEIARSAAIVGCPLLDHIVVTADPAKFRSMLS